MKKKLIGIEEKKLGRERYNFLAFCLEEMLRQKSSEKINNRFLFRIQVIIILSFFQSNQTTKTHSNVKTDSAKDERVGVREGRGFLFFLFKTNQRHRLEFGVR